MKAHLILKCAIFISLDNKFCCGLFYLQLVLVVILLETMGSMYIL